MKKLIVLLMLCTTLFLILSYLPQEKVDNKKVENNEKKVEKKVINEERGVFISYIDYGNLNGLTKEDQEKTITEMVNNVSYFGLNSIILQVRAFSDAIYPSEFYMSSKTLGKEGDPLKLDVLKYFIDEAKDKNIKVYAWINPYRIRNTNDINDLSKEAYYYKWLNTDKIEVSSKGIYLNPASKEVVDYITKGVKEICENYDIEGIIYDDYFYPNDTIDLKTYEKTNKQISLKTYRINNINYLLEETYKTIKNVNEEIKFGISPAGNIENNLDKEYLDVKNILKGDFLDLIIPQLYYGFNNQNKPYINTLNDWSNLNIKKKDFYVALSLYKSGKVDIYAGKGENEWLKNTDILKKQILISRNIKNYKGFYIFRYEYLFKTYDNDNLKEEVTNIKQLIDIS